MPFGGGEWRRWRIWAFSDGGDALMGQLPRGRLLPCRPVGYTETAYAFQDRQMEAVCLHALVAFL